MSSSESAEKVLAGFNQYDVLGYLSPGAATVVCAFLYEFWLTKHLPNSDKMILPIYGIATQFAENLQEKPWVILVLFFFIATWTIYILGHVVASVGAIVVDRTLVSKGHGYPFVRMLRLTPKPDADVTRSFYRGMFFWLTIYLAARYLFLCFETVIAPATAATVHSALLAVGWMMVAILVAKVFVSAKQVRSWALRYRAVKIISDTLKVFLKIACAPYSLVTRALSHFLGVRHRLPESFCEQFKDAFQKKFDLDPVQVGTENYWLSYIHVRANNAALTDMADNWMRLYSFARNLSAGLYLSFLYCHFVVWLNDFHFDYSPTQAVSALLPISLLIASLILLLRYYYLYSSYYTKFVLRSFLYLTKQPDEKKESGH